MDVIQRVHRTVAEGLAHADAPQMQVIAQLAGQQKLLPYNALPYQVRPHLHTPPPPPAPRLSSLSSSHTAPASLLMLQQHSNHDIVALLQ